MSHQAAFALIHARSRLAALARFDVMGSEPESGFDDIVRLAAQICEAPISTVTLVDDKRQWFKARVGFKHSETPLVDSVCACTLDEPGLFVVNDLSMDPRTCDILGVNGEPRLRFYARTRLDTDRGEPLGTLCVIDFEPRSQGLRPSQAEALAALGRQVMSQLELRRAVAERLKNEAALYESQARLRAIFETSYQFQGFLAPNGTLLDANAHALDAIDRPLEDVVGLRFWDTPWFARTPDMPAQMRAAVQRAGLGETVRREIELDLPGGRRLFDFALRPVRDADGVVLGIVPEAVDMTDYRRIENRLRQAQKLEAVGQLTGGIAHDFNNMLAIVLGFLELAKRQLGAPSDDAVAGYLANAAAGAERAVALTKRLLDFARHQPLPARPLDVNELIETMSELLHRSLSQLVRLEFALGDNLWAVRVDRAQIENALINLSVNACDAMPDGGTLLIRTENVIVGSHEVDLIGCLTPGQYVMIAVKDTGVGMTPSVVERAFEPFYTTKGVGQGTGLGLSQVFGFVTRSGGHVKIDSEVDRGTIVRLYLPRHVGEESVPTLEPTKTSNARVPVDACVLVVEDEQQVREMSVESLKELGYRVRAASSPEDALRQVTSDLEIDLLFTDIVMPGLTGPQLAERALQARPTLKVLFTTGCQHRAGLNCATPPDALILTKPFALDQLAEKVQLALTA